MTTVLVKTSQSSPRLIFVLDWLFTERLKINYRLVNTVPDGNTTPLITYGGPDGQGISIPDAGLLWETDIVSRNVPADKWKGVPSLFTTQNTTADIPFDLLSALFYLISRYEEYLPHSIDKYERYPAIDSILYRLGHLETPIADVWIHEFKKILGDRFGISFPAQQYNFIPTYDIDIAWCYRHKGLLRTTGAFVKNMLQGEVIDIIERITVLTGLKKDPYNSFGFLKSCHSPNGLQPIFFILSSLKTTTLDKNISPRHPAMKKLVAQLAGKNTMGIHPSYFSQENGTINKELRILEKTTGKKITLSRQHYLHMRMPDTYRLLISLGITTDYTMGYGTHLGFRAGTSHPFPWYDLGNEEPTSLTLYPFCFMDTTAHFNQQLSAADAFTKLEAMTQKLQQLDGLLITVFHNFSIGTDRRWKNWQQYYSNFLAKQGRFLKSQYGNNNSVLSQ